jgi:hypothetical protein
VADVADAHRDDGKRFIVRADEKLTAFGRARAERPKIAAKTNTPLGMVETRLEFGL